MKNEKMILNGEEITLGSEKLIALGYNVHCETVIKKLVLNKSVEGHYYAMSDGIQIIIYESDLSGIFKDTRENRMKLVESISN